MLAYQFANVEQQVVEVEDRRRSLAILIIVKQQLK